MTSSINSTFDKDVYFVAAKLFIRDGGKLLITHDIFGDWDLPGGRFKKDELHTPIESIIDRKVREELGEEFRYELGAPKVFFRVERTEARTGESVRIFAVGYEAVYMGGKVILGEHHDHFEWVELREFKPDAYFKNGWLDGVRQYCSFALS